MWRFDSVVVSDLHLGAANSRTDAFLSFLDWVQTRQLILGGDVFDTDTLKHLSDKHLRVLDALRIFARDHEVIWLRGNHDPSLQYFRSVLGVSTRDEYILNAGGNEYLVYHGHEWDGSLKLPSWIIHGADTVYHWSQWIDPSHEMARALKRRCKRFCKAIDRLRAAAVCEAHRRSLFGVILGHTHVARDEMVNGIHYLNSGCWTEKPAGFIGVRGSTVRQYFWEAILLGGSDLQPGVLPVDDAMLPAMAKEMQ
jgi:UDP-2,3-diacylglucosamine pyrophosphatase LpxH